MDRDPPDDTRTTDAERDDPEWNRDRFPAWDSEEGALRAARSEARESLAETIRAIRRIDQSAMRTLRIDLVILGLSLTVASSFQSVSRLVNELTVSGFVAIGLSTIVAIVTTLGTGYPTGVSEEYVAEFQRASWTEREWNEWMVREYSEWLSEANEMLNAEAQVLFYTKALLGAGLVLLMLGVVSGIVGFTDAITEFGIAAST
ncbi:hypothetical protein [Halorussus lipolyticus]|uniref:hypothetical protein n=1 Tax=Halorussus lipolyticus TaxID=3034024 RepID=UPI0023E8C0D4|nr:hypothetical protein [Halorussus sp. DT80]